MRICSQGFMRTGSCYLVFRELQSSSLSLCVHLDAVVSSSFANECMGPACGRLRVRKGEGRGNPTPSLYPQPWSMPQAADAEYHNNGYRHHAGVSSSPLLGGPGYLQLGYESSYEPIITWLPLLRGLISGSQLQLWSQLCVPRTSKQPV